MHGGECDEAVRWRLWLWWCASHLGDIRGSGAVECSLLTCKERPSSDMIMFSFLKYFPKSLIFICFVKAAVIFFPLNLFFLKLAHSNVRESNSNRS